MLPLIALVALTGCANAAATVARPTGPATAASPRADRPAYAVGDRWIRSDGIFELIRIEGDTYVFAPDGRNEIHLAKDLAVVRHRTFSRTYFEFTPTPRLDWPLQVGKRGAVAGRFQSLGGDSYDAALQWVVDAHEDVTVPAGTFNAFRITFTITPHQTSFGTAYRNVVQPGSVTYRFWYAPDVRQFVKADGDLWPMRFELVAIDPGESEPLKVVVHEPADQARFGPEADVALTGKATGGKGVVRMTVAVNGDVVATESPKGDLRKTILLNQRLPLRDGKNVILVTATDVGGTTSQEARTVFYSAPFSIALPAKDETRRVGEPYVLLRVPLPTDRTVSAVSVALNEVVVGAAHPTYSVGDAFEARLQLREGQNLIRIRYDSSTGQRVEERTIVFDPTLGAPVQRAGASEAPALTEEQRLAEERRRRVEAQRLAAEQKLAEERRQADGKRSRDEEQRLAEEKRRQAEEQRLATDRRRAEEQRLAEEQRRREDAQRVATLPPLQLTLSSPRDQARFEHESIGLAGTVGGGKGVSRLTVTLNGMEVSRQEEPTPQRAVALNLPIVLREGQNTLVVAATEADGTLSQEVRTVFFDKAQPLMMVVRFPQDQARVTEPSTVAAAIVSSGRGVARVTVSVNGVEAHHQTERTPQKSLLVTAPLKLNPGINVIAFSAADMAGR